MLPKIWPANLGLLTPQIPVPFVPILVEMAGKLNPPALLQAGHQPTLFVDSCAQQSVELWAVFVPQHRPEAHLLVTLEGTWLLFGGNTC